MLGEKYFYQFDIITSKFFNSECCSSVHKLLTISGYNSPLADNWVMYFIILNWILIQKRVNFL